MRASSTRAGSCRRRRSRRGALLKTAKSGGYPAFLADLRDDRGAAVPFFGRPARSNVFPALLARTTGLPLYAGAAYRLPDVRFRSVSSRVPIPETDDRDADAVAAHRRPSGPVRSLHPRGARTVDVGPPKVGLATAAHRSETAAEVVRVALWSCPDSQLQPGSMAREARLRRGRCRGWSTSVRLRTEHAWPSGRSGSFSSSRRITTTTAMSSSGGARPSPRTASPASTACSRECAEERVLGPDVDIEIEAYDECNTVIDVARRSRSASRRPAADSSALVGVQSNQFPRALDLAPPVPRAGRDRRGRRLPCLRLHRHAARTAAGPERGAGARHDPLRGRGRRPDGRAPARHRRRARPSPSTIISTTCRTWRPPRFPCCRARS